MFLFVAISLAWAIGQGQPDHSLSVQPEMQVQHLGPHKLKIRRGGATFLVKIDGDRITVDRREKMFRHNTGPDQREDMRAVARAITGCELKNEYFNMWQFALEADLVCGATGPRL